MFFSDHAPPHFHARYGEHEAVVDIRKLELIEGKLPRRALNLVLDWRNCISPNSGRIGSSARTCSNRSRLPRWSKAMDWDVTEVKVAGDHALWVRFRDGVEGAVKFTPGFFRGVFSHLEDQVQFQQVMLVDGVVTWPGDLDLAPDAMHKEIKARGEWVLGAGPKTTNRL